MTLIDDSAKPLVRHQAALWLASVVIIVALIVISIPVYQAYPVKSSAISSRESVPVSSFAKDDKPSIFNSPQMQPTTTRRDEMSISTEDSELTLTFETSIPDAIEMSEEEAQFSDGLSDQSVAADIGIDSDDTNPSNIQPLPQEPMALEKKIAQDFKNTIDRLAQANEQQSVQKPKPSRTLKEEAVLPQPTSPPLTTAPSPAIVLGKARADDSARARTKPTLSNDLIILETLTVEEPEPEEKLAEIPAESDSRQLLREQVLRESSSTYGSKHPKLILEHRQNRTVSSGYQNQINDLTATAESAQQFLTDINSLDGLSFQDPNGYWANTYVPGDPLMRQLAARLQQSKLSLSQDIQQNQQPFDAPTDAALALYLNADKAFIDQPSRLRVQIGLKGSLRQGGQRPAMNIAVVLDRQQTLSNLAAVRALLFALQQAQQPGDRFTLISAGAAGGLLVPADQFRFGPLQLALKRLADRPDSSEENLTLAEAVTLAADQVRQSDDQDAVLGSSLVLLVTPSSLENDLAALTPIAHQNAVDGIFLSIVSLDQTIDETAIQQLVLLGQGNRRQLTHPDQTKALIDRELYATSRAVARAIRLRIRLAAGVKLVDILGSRPLQEPEAQRVREAEQSIDRRMARNLGIKADRGEDEEGVQIVIPHFYADDAHVILLDVVAERPGAIVEVSARYKDLVALGNGVAHAQLQLDETSRAPGPLQRNVLKNLLAYQLTAASRQAGQQLAAGSVQQALQTLISIRRLFTGMRQHIVAWTNDRELLHDERLLDDYLAQLTANRLPPQQGADALRYLAFRKLTPGGESL